MYRDGTITGRHLHRAANWTREEAKHFLLHDAHGRALLRDTGGDIDALADHLVEASQRPTEKRKDTNMSDTQSFTKSVADLGEHGYTSIIQKYASDNRLPNETAAQAFTRIFTEDSAQGAAIRKFWQISKQGVADEPDDDDDEADAWRRLERNRGARRRHPQAFSDADEGAGLHQGVHRPG